MNGNPIDWLTTSSVPYEGMKAALSQDLDGPVPNNHSLLVSPRCHIGFIVNYVSIPLDGTLIMTYALDYIPTSMETVTLTSSDPRDKPLIDHNHYATEADRYRIRTGARMIAKLMNTSEMKEMVSDEALPEGYKAITEESTNEDIDVRVREGAMYVLRDSCWQRDADDFSTIQHPAGTASMGEVVDTNLRVIGVKGLRIVDASVIPTPIASPIQACVYGLGEQAVDIIMSSS